MEHLNYSIISILCFTGFISAFIDAVVGGGGLIAVPALLLTGLPPATVLGTNKVAGTMGSLTSTITFLRSGKIQISLVKYLVIFSLVGSALGALTVRQIPATFLKPLIVVLLILVTVYTLTNKNLGQKSSFSGLSRKVFYISLLMAFFLGFYDGFFGPGAGSFLIFAFLLLGFDFVVASGNAKALNFASNIAAAVMFIALGAVRYDYAIPMGLAMILGAIAGSRTAIKKGVSFVRPIFIAITALLISKQIFDMFGR